MAVSVVPTLIDALIAQTNAAGVLAVDNYYQGEQPPDTYVIIGSTPEDGSSAETQQSWTYANTTTRNETGEVDCFAWSQSGNSTIKEVRDAVYAAAEVVAGVCRANPSLGLTNLLWASFGTTTKFDQNPDGDGAWALLEFRILFESQI